MRQIATTSKYRKDWELAKRRNLPIEELNDVIYKLANDFTLSKKTMLCKGIMSVIGNVISNRIGC